MPGMRLLFSAVFRCHENAYLVKNARGGFMRQSAIAVEVTGEEKFP